MTRKKGHRIILDIVGQAHVRNASVAKSQPSGFGDSSSAGDGMAATVVGRRRRHACRRRGFAESGKGPCARVEAEQSDGEKHVLFGPLRKWRTAKRVKSGDGAVGLPFREFSKLFHPFLIGKYITFDTRTVEVVQTLHAAAKEKDNEVLSCSYPGMHHR